MRIGFFGDSFVNGTGDDACLGWAGRLCAAARRAGHDLTFYNLGVRGNTSRDIHARWLAEARLRLDGQPNARLVFSFGANDAAAGEAEGGGRLSATETLAHAREILAQAAGWLPTLMIGPPPICDDPAACRRIDALSAGMENICRELGVPYLAICQSLLMESAWRREAAAGDGCHPNGEGYARLARLVAAWPAWRAWLSA